MTKYRSHADAVQVLIGQIVRARVGHPTDLSKCKWTEGTLLNVKGNQALMPGQGWVNVQRVYGIDLDGDPYHFDEYIGPWKMTPCCGGAATGIDSGVVCKACYGDANDDGPARLPVNHLTSSESFQVHATERDGRYVGYVYLGTEIVWTLDEPAEATPAGIEDFANVTMTKFAKRLAAVLTPEED